MRPSLVERGPVWQTAGRHQELWDALPEGPTGTERKSLVAGAWPGLVRPSLPAWPLHDPAWPHVTRGWDVAGEMVALVGVDALLQETAPLMRTGLSPDVMLLAGPGGRALLKGVTDGIEWALLSEGLRRWLGAEWDRAGEPVAILGVPKGAEVALSDVRWPAVPIVLDGRPDWVRRARRALPATLDVRGLR